MYAVVAKTVEEVEENKCNTAAKKCDGRAANIRKSKDMSGMCHYNKNPNKADTSESIH